MTKARVLIGPVTTPPYPALAGLDLNAQSGSRLVLQGLNALLQWMAPSGVLGRTRPLSRRQCLKRLGRQPPSLHQTA